MSEASDPIRIAYTIEQCWHRVPGGTAVAGIELARALVARPDASLVGVAARHRTPPPPPWAPPLEVRHLALPRPVLYEAWHYLRAPRVERATGVVDAIHATTIAIPPRSRPIVLTIHDVAFLEFPQHYSGRGLRFFRRGLELALRDADLVLCSSEATRRGCETAGFEAERLRKVPLGLDARPASEEQVAETRRRYGLERPYVLWSGTIEPRKNLRRLLAAFERVPTSADLVLVGPTGWNEDLGALVAPLQDRVKTPGFVPRRDLEALYAGAEAFCFPSLAEGFGFPVLEAMAQGVPVVTSSGTSTEELAGDAGVLVDPLSEESIAGGITSILEDDALARRLREAGPARAARYTWARTAELVARCYAEVAKKA